ncbi:nad-dependent epimerase/dehydratase domain protein, putative [Heliomicrobium modesticaldum Ice1]|uniref:Nad-dependent epimerase/dehydratase domain protein, putative n=1 Tax=Heliobacterium modesticaldum (strain ATCC 51547 / Ice1) TaxID=498761 RepID=B0THJ4_HELMI|nr:NAD-dependent epimerase/dehydratase family protein [Heliomicrobium modesticaldum]ABZ83432.1 nad-dependent epimerase/dehydratase domain protein, putative [Heliomicrobium modesticaldum Ice1]
MIFILGGNGFVGSAFVRWCEEQQRPYVNITRDNYKDYVGQRCDVFVNANGNSKKFLAAKEPMSDFALSVESVRRSLEDFHYGVYVYLSSCDVYPDCSTSDANSEDTVIDVRQQSPYGFHKYLAEQCVRHRAEKWLILRMGGFVGPNLKKNPIYDILHGGPLWVDPESELQFLPTDEMPRIVTRILEAGRTNETFNTCGRGVVKLSDVMKRSGRHVNVVEEAARVRYEVNVSKLSRIFDIPESSASVQNYITMYK